MGARVTFTVISFVSAVEILHFSTEPASAISAHPAVIADAASMLATKDASVTTARWLTLASVFARRMTPIAPQMASSSSSFGPLVRPSVNSFVVGHCDWCTDPVCHQFHTSSVTKGRSGASRRCKVESARRNAARADMAPSSE